MEFRTWSALRNVKQTFRFAAASLKAYATSDFALCSWHDLVRSQVCHRSETCCARDPWERRDARDRRETTIEGPSPGQVTDLAGAVHTSRKRGFPRRRPGARE